MGNILGAGMPSGHRDGTILSARTRHRQPAVSRWVDNVRGNRCLLCEGPGLDRCLCPACLADLPWQGEACPTCALPIPDTAEDCRCASCRLTPPVWDDVRAVFRYAFPIDRLIAAFKYHERLALGDLFGQLLASQADPLERADRLLPVPLHPRRLRARGSHQTALLARTCSAALGLPLDLRGLQRVRDTEMQKGLDRAARQDNLAGAFAWQGGSLAGEHVVVIDDVMTTGATLAAITPLLKAAGAVRVSAWVVARTPPD